MTNRAKVMLAVILVAIAGAVVFTQTDLLKGTFGIQAEVEELQMRMEDLNRSREEFIQQRLEDMGEDASEEMLADIYREADERYGAEMEDLNRMMEELHDMAAREEADSESGSGSNPEWHKSAGYDGPIGEQECKELHMLLCNGKLSSALNNDMSAPAKCAKRFPHIWGASCSTSKPAPAGVTLARCDQIDGMIAQGLSSTAKSFLADLEACKKKFPHVMKSKQPTPTPIPVTEARCKQLAQWIQQKSTNTYTLGAEIDQCKKKYPKIMSPIAYKRCQEIANIWRRDALATTKLQNEINLCFKNHPDALNNVTRVGLVEMISDVKAYPKKKGCTSKYPDVDKADTCMVNRAIKEGWIAGYVTGKFGPDRFVNWAEFMKVVSDAFGLQNKTKKVTVSPLPVNGGTLTGQEWYYKYAKYMYETGAMSKTFGVNANDTVHMNDALRIVSTAVTL